ncbi:MAG TPA: hypothetical protein VFG14_07295 [Chthoniobacteraceae bacterium]|nr:hypothetical protein [Chthoniobacteraceae bacterium]
MKSELQQYEGKTRQMVWISGALVALGVFIYAMWSGVGVVIALVGFAGLVWCFLRR